MRRWAVGLLLGAGALWVVIVIAVLTTRPEDGANIGAGLLFMLALPATVTGVVLLAVAARQGTPKLAAPPGLIGVARPGTAQAGWSLALGILGILMGMLGVGPTVITSVAINVVGVGVSVSAVALARAVRSREATPAGVALGGLVTGIIGLVFAALSVAGLILDATIG
jgi:hypothetical protein